MVEHSMRCVHSAQGYYLRVPSLNPGPCGQKIGCPPNGAGEPIIPYLQMGRWERPSYPRT
eukprot:51272-Pelagomonas_calceolata.AAC.1